MSRGAFFAWLALFAVFSSVSADTDHEHARRLVEEGRILPLEYIVAELHGRTDGVVLETELERENGRLIYSLEFLDNQGVVHEFEYDAVSGELIKEKTGD